jgi:YVTN family beta-propeller protein
MVAVVSALVTSSVNAEVNVTTYDLLRTAGLEVNAAGPMLVKADPARNRIVVVNAISSSLTIINGATDRVTNIPIGHRGVQHLKSAAMAIRESTGTVYLIATKCLVVVDPENGSAESFATRVQLESVAVDDRTGNALVCGRESGKLGFYDAATGKLQMLDWLDHAEPLVNLNMTPPPPIRRVIAVPGGGPDAHGLFAVIDGLTATLYLFNAGTGEQISTRSLGLTSGGRWHLAGVNGKTAKIYLVIETDDRKVVEAAEIDLLQRYDLIVPLPELTEAVSPIYNPKREQIYIPYDNHATVHMVEFGGTAKGKVSEIAVPDYGNDASALDIEHDLLYIASWAHGEIEVIDLARKRFIRKIEGLGIIPHMFSMTFNPANGQLYFPIGATAVNGCFGAAVTRLDPDFGTATKIRTGWAPIELIELQLRDSFLVFSNEDQFAEIEKFGIADVRDLPHPFPLHATHGPDEEVYLAYGPHQSYWPAVYIWGARNGLLSIDQRSLSFNDRRLPRQSLAMATDKDGVLYLAQNNWGKEKQILSVVEDSIRNPSIEHRIELEDRVARETTQRILRYDGSNDMLYLVRIGEQDSEPSIVQVIDVAERQLVQRLTVGRNATDLIFNKHHLYVANFGSDSVSVIDKETWAVTEKSVGDAPFKLAQAAGKVLVLNHLGGSIEEVAESGVTVALEVEGLPDNMMAWRGKLVITAHSPEQLTILLVDPRNGAVETIHQLSYPFGETRLDTTNSAFYMSGQLADGVLTPTKGKTDQYGNLWISDFLAGKVLKLAQAR